MLKIIKTIKESAEKINALIDKVNNIERNNTKLSKVIEDRNIYTAIGIPFPENYYDKRIQLLIEARKRGYFADNNYFVPIGDGWSETSYFKHYYSNIASSYGYDEEDDSLRIPVIGVKGNFSSCRICIYKNGEWAKLMKNN